MSEFSNDDRNMLIRLDERMKTVHDCLKDHLRKHWTISVLFIATLITSMGSLITTLFISGCGKK